MKEIRDIIKMLGLELNIYLKNLKNIKHHTRYYNELLGDTSFLLAGLLEALIKKLDGWDRDRWIDDSLITKVLVKNNKLTIEGIMIWGRENITEQWTDPFVFETALIEDKVNLELYTFLFCDADNTEIPYEEFAIDRDYWEKSKREWKYKIYSSKSSIDDE